MLRFLCVFTVLVALAATADAELKRICYFPNWAQYRPSPGTFKPANINERLCTHLIYSFAQIINSTLLPFEWNDDSMYKEFNQKKLYNPSLKTLLAVGGWNAGTMEMSRMLSNAEERNIFINSTIETLRKYDFDGFDLDFEYPAARGSPPEDKERFSDLIKEFREAFEKEAAESNKPRLLLSAAVAASKSIIENSYNATVLNDYLDWIGLMSYDFVSSYNNTNFNAPLYSSSDSDELSMDWAANYWVSQGVSRDKLVLGMASYGRCFILQDLNDTSVGAPAIGPCPGGAYSKLDGFLTYYEICQYLTWEDTVKRFSNIHQTPYLIYGRLWIGYDDEYSLLQKLDYVKNNSYAGWMLWDLSMDDFTGTFCPSRRRNPLLSTLNGLIAPSKPDIRWVTRPPWFSSGKERNSSSADGDLVDDTLKGIRDVFNRLNKAASVTASVYVTLFVSCLLVVLMG